MVASFLCDFDGGVLQIDVVTDGVFLREHCLVGALGELGGELAFLGPIRVSLLGDILQVDCGKHLLDLLLPATGHLLHRVHELKVLNDLEGIALLEALTAVLVELAVRIVVTRADRALQRLVLRRRGCLSDGRHLSVGF